MPILTDFSIERINHDNFVARGEFASDENSDCTLTIVRLLTLTDLRAWLADPGFPECERESFTKFLATEVTVPAGDLN